jgi:hypothetical protein
MSNKSLRASRAREREKPDCRRCANARTTAAEQSVAIGAGIEGGGRGNIKEICNEATVNTLQLTTPRIDRFAHHFFLA